MADTEAICRLVSLALRGGVDASKVVKQLRGIGGSAQVFSKGSKVTSIPDAIAQVLARQAGLDAKTWIGADVLRSSKHRHTQKLSASPLVGLAASLGRFGPVRFLLGNDLYLKCEK